MSIYDDFSDFDYLCLIGAGCKDYVATNSHISVSTLPLF